MNVLDVLKPIDDKQTIINTKNLLNKIPMFINLSGCTMGSLRTDKVGSRSTNIDHSKNFIVAGDAMRVLDAIKETINHTSEISKIILTKMYLMALPPSELKLANELGYSTRHVRRLKNSALIEFAEMWVFYQDKYKISPRVNLCVYKGQE
ncbi:hypothetical protein [Lactobacillus sp. PSON]|uniref:hypothetical protein n=1 Tax=Lactobacillus sp. PSON TaxID=3455454 RepID=UPI0040422A38